MRAILGVDNFLGLVERGEFLGLMAGGGFNLRPVFNDRNSLGLVVRNGSRGCSSVRLKRLYVDGFGL
jgi:hypothetical protein